MILADTSVWIDHLRGVNEALGPLLQKCQILMHPFIVGEVACGNLKNRTGVLALLQRLPQASVASEDEVLSFIETRELMGCGIGYIDAHLLAATALAPGARLWTRDRKLADVAADLRVSFAT